MKKLLRLLAMVLALVLVPFVPAWGVGKIPVGANEKQGKIGIYIRDTGTLPMSMVVNQRSKETGTERFCSSLTTDGCEVGTDDHLTYSAILPICTTIVENCVESVNIYKADGTKTEAKYLRNVAGSSFPAVKNAGNQQASTPSIWEVASLPNAAGSTKYVATAIINFRYLQGKVTVESFDAAINPVYDKYSPEYKPTNIGFFTDKNGKRFSVTDFGDSDGLEMCAATDVGYCAYKTDFAEGSRASMTLRITNKLTGWLHGRLGSPDISITKIDDSLNKVIVDAAPLVVPNLYAEVDEKKDSKQLISDVAGYRTGGGLSESENTWRVMVAGSSHSVYLTKKLSARTNETAFDTVTTWSFHSIKAGNYGNKCLNDRTRLLGLVTTNALAYSGTVPIWRNGMLDYEVAGTHFMPDGKTIALGTYDLAMRSETARCLYGFSKASISATISVVGSKGEKKVATTTVSEKNGWLKLAAYGFTFSSPKIRVKLTQKKR